MSLALEWAVENNCQLILSDERVQTVIQVRNISSLQKESNLTTFSIQRNFGNRAQIGVKIKTILVISGWSLGQTEPLAKALHGLSLHARLRTSWLAGQVHDIKLLSHCSLPLSMSVYILQL
jgi:hypothetical protein